MTIKFTSNGKVDRLWDGNPDYVDEIIDALDECVAALREIGYETDSTADESDTAIARDTLRKIGV